MKESHKAIQGFVRFFLLNNVNESKVVASLRF